MRISDWSSDVCSSDLRGKMMRILWTGAATLALAVSGAMPAAAEELRGEVAKQMPSLMAIYKALHAHPELSFMEVRSAGILAAEARKLGLDRKSTRLNSSH